MSLRRRPTKVEARLDVSLVVAWLVLAMLILSAQA